MGKIVSVICNKCDYQPKDVTIGSAKANMETYCGVPVWNTETDEIETVNKYCETEEVVIKKSFLYFFKRQIKVQQINKKYIPYYEPKMFIGDTKIRKLQWWSDFYKFDENYCPKCKTFNVEFQLKILFD